MALVCCGAPARAQRPSSWATLQTSGPINLSSVQQLGKILTYQDAGKLHVFSAFRRRWVSLPVSANATLRIANDWALVIDGASWHAFSAWRGAFASLQLGAGATVLNPATQRNDSLLLVHDAQDVWSFSGFTGQWTRHAVAAPPLVAVQRHTAVLVDGGRAFGISAFGGGWIPGPSVAAPTSLRADGTTGVLEDQGRWHGFSALRRTWSTEAGLGTVAQWQLDDDLAVWADGVRCVGFSGLRGTFATSVTGPAQRIDTDERAAAVTIAGAVHLYSAVLAAWTVLPTAATPAITVDSDMVLLTESSALHAYSAHTGTIATRPGAHTNASSANAVAAAQDAQGSLHLYSALAAIWQPAPSAATAMPWLAGNAVLLQSAAGWAAFSARGGRIVPLPGVTSTATPHVDPQSSILALEDATHLHVFEARRDAWLSMAHAGRQPLMVRIWRTTLLAWDGVRAIGFGVQEGELEALAVAAPLLDLTASSESGRVAAGNQLIGFAAVGDLSSLWQMPEFRRTFVRGAELELQLAATPGAIAGGVLALAPLVVPRPLPPLGPLLVDTSAVLPLPLSAVDADGRAFARFFVPDDPALAGMELFLQAVVVPAAGSPYLTRLCTVMLR